MSHVIYADTIENLYWQVAGECRRMIEDFQDRNSGPGHYWTWEEIQDANPNLSIHPRPPYIDGDNKRGLALEFGRSLGAVGLDFGLPSLFKRSTNKPLIKIEKAQKR